jgi:RNA polymerase sigma-70 factor (ECF subfamily)
MLHIGADSALTKDGSPVDGICEPLSIARMILQHHASLLCFLRRRLRVSEDADDVAQETYVRMMQYEGSREVRSPASLLFRIAINVANDLGRYQVTHREADRRSLEDVELVCELPSAEREIQARQDVELVYRAIEEMPPKCRQVFLLSRVRKMTYPEIARHCGISLKAVEKHISRGLAICAQKVGGHPRGTS